MWDESTDVEKRLLEAENRLLATEKRIADLETEINIRLIPSVKELGRRLAELGDALLKGFDERVQTAVGELVAYYNEQGVASLREAQASVASAADDAIAKVRGEADRHVRTISDDLARTASAKTDGVLIQQVLEKIKPAAPVRVQPPAYVRKDEIKP